MKKSLLFAFVACCAMSVNAQSIKNHLSANKAEVTFAAPAFNKASVAKSSVAAPTVAAAPKKSPVVCDNTDSSHSVWGNYKEIMAFEEYTGAASVTVELEEADGVKWAVMRGLFRGFGEEVYGVYDEEAKTITVAPEEYVGMYNYQGQDLYLYVYSVEAADEENSFNYRGEFDEEGNVVELYPVVFNVEETEDGLVVAMPEGQGWFLNAYSGLDEDAEYLGGFVAGMEETLHKTNAVAQYYFSEPADGGWTEWAEDLEEYYVEKYDESMMIYGVRDQFVIEIDYDKATGEASLANQPVWHNSNPDFWFGVHGCYIDGKNLKVGEGDDFSVPGVYSDEKDYLALYDFNVEGDPQAQYFYICSDVDSDGRGYFYSIFTSFEVFGMCGQAFKDTFSDGIDTVLAPSAKSARYNLAGQRTNTYVKGINIEGGKKVVR